jgi:hypothetical protein
MGHAKKYLDTFYIFTVDYCWKSTQKKDSTVRVQPINSLFDRIPSFTWLLA